jgi:hypothetical protein
MYIVVIAWFYVAVLMAVAEATSSTGTLLGALITFLLYGLLPIGIVMYVMGSPLRKKARLAAEAQAQTHSPTSPTPESGQSAGVVGLAPDQGRHAPGAAPHSGVAAVREKP